ncbi:hypothetical protein DESC_770031 [Desulfosarcina cetonica]|nr:hypothetical protein DESC_770031 [Desulfosarcina cetonica]
MPALRRRPLRGGLPGLRAPPFQGGAQQPDLQSLHRHAFLRPELPLQGTAVQLVRLAVARSAGHAAQPLGDRAQQGRHGEMLLLHPAHQTGPQRGQERKSRHPRWRGDAGLRSDLPHRRPDLRQPDGPGKPGESTDQGSAGLSGDGVSQHQAGGDLSEESGTDRLGSRGEKSFAQRHNR